MNTVLSENSAPSPKVSTFVPSGARTSFSFSAKVYFFAESSPYFFANFALVFSAFLTSFAGILLPKMTEDLLLMEIPPETVFGLGGVDYLC